jgi:F-type H+-transporting ATPase subunit delta
MLITKAARRYASALLQVAEERNEVETILEDINLIKDTLEGSRELVVFLRSPVIKYDDKAGVLKTLFGDKVQKPTQLFLELLARKNRIQLLDEITHAFIELYYEYAGIIMVDVVTAGKLDKEQQRSLQDMLENKTGKKVKLRLSVDKDLKGGMSIRIDDTVIDGTVKHKLEQLENLFLEPEIG